MATVPQAGLVGSPSNFFAESRLLSINASLFLAGFLRVLSILVLRTFQHPRTWEFGEIAHNLVSGHGFTFSGMASAYMPPGYPMALAGVFASLGESVGVYFGIEIAQAALGVLLVYLVYALTMELYRDRATARLAALLTALYPPFIQMCNEFHSINVYIVLGVAVLLFLVKAREQPSEWRYLSYAAVCMGLLLLFRAEALGLAFLLALLLPLRQGLRAGIAPAFCFLAISYSFLVPWTARNYLLFHAFVPTTTAFGDNLWIGHNPLATGSDRTDDGGYVEQKLPPAMRAELKTVPPGPTAELQHYAVFKRNAVSYIVSHPKREMVLTGLKFWKYWTFDSNHEKGRQPAFWVPSVALSLFGLAGLFVGKKPSLSALSPLLTTIAFSILLAVVFFTLPRYKMAIDPLLCIFAANAGTFLISEISARRGSPEGIHQSFSAPAGASR